MGKINVARWFLGGIVAGVVGDVVGTLVNGVWLQHSWNAAFRLRGLGPMTGTEIIEYNLIGLCMGLAGLWIYVGIRPRFGAGARTAVYAGLAVWFVGYLLPNIAFMYVPHAYSRHLTLYATLGDLVACVLAAVAGAALYKEA